MKVTSPQDSNDDDRPNDLFEAKASRNPPAFLSNVNEHCSESDEDTEDTEKNEDQKPEDSSDEEESHVVPEAEASRDVLGGAAGQSQSSMERTVTSSSSSRNISDAHQKIKNPPTFLSNVNEHCSESDEDNNEKNKEYVICHKCNKTFLFTI